MNKVAPDKFMQTYSKKRLHWKLANLESLWPKFLISPRPALVGYASRAVCVGLAQVSTQHGSLFRRPLAGGFRIKNHGLKSNYSNIGHID